MSDQVVTGGKQTGPSGPVYVNCGSATRAAAEAKAIAAKPDHAVAPATGYLVAEKQKDN